MPRSTQYKTLFSRFYNFVAVSSVLHRSVRMTVPSFTWRNQMFGQLSGDVVATDFHLNQMHCQREFVRIQEAIFVDIGELPDLPQDGVGQFGFDHFCFGVGTGDFSVHGVERGEDGVVLVPFLVDDPVRLPLPFIDTCNKKNRIALNKIPHDKKVDLPHFESKYL